LGSFPILAHAHRSHVCFFFRQFLESRYTSSAVRTLLPQPSDIGRSTLPVCDFLSFFFLNLARGRTIRPIGSSDRYTQMLFHCSSAQCVARLFFSKLHYHLGTSPSSMSPRPARYMISLSSAPVKRTSQHPEISSTRSSVNRSTGRRAS